MPTWSQGIKQFFTLNNGKPAVGGKLYTYANGTTTPKAVFKDALFTIPHTNPVVLDSRGEELIYWDGLYKVALKYPSGKGIWTVSGVNGSGLVLTTPDVLDLPPVANFTFTPAVLTAPASGTFTNTSQNLTGADSFTWSLDGVPQSTSLNAFLSFALEGSYVVTLRVENENGDDTKTRVINVEPPPLPVPSFTWTASGLIATITNTTAGFLVGDIAMWEDGYGSFDPFPNAEVPFLINYPIAGSYVVTLNVIRGGTSYGPFTSTVTVTGGSGAGDITEITTGEIITELSTGLTITEV